MPNGSLGGEAIVYVSSTKSVNWDIQGFVDSLGYVNWDILVSYFTQQDNLYEKDFDGILRTLNRGVVDGLRVQPSSPAAMTVDVESGRAFFEDYSVKIASNTLTVTAADGSNDRKDLVLLSRDGTLSIVDGTPASIPRPPDYDCVRWDDCEDTTQSGDTWTAYGTGATTGTTTTHIEGSNALFLKGGTGDNPYCMVTLSSTQDWSDYKGIQWKACPLNDDATPATGETCYMHIEDNATNYARYNLVLSSTADKWRTKICELNNSGFGDPPEQSSGTLDTSNIKYVYIRISSATDNLDLAFDDINLYRDDKVILAQITVPTSTSDIQIDDIRDERKIIYGNRYKDNFAQANPDEGECEMYDDGADLIEDNWEREYDPMKQWGG